jgi:hypothetical protein
LMGMSDDDSFELTDSATMAVVANVQNGNM